MYYWELSCYASDPGLQGHLQKSGLVVNPIGVIVSMGDVWSKVRV